ARSAAAQTPEASPSGDGEVITNTLTREEAMATIEEAFDFEEPQNQGGEVIYQETTDIQTLNSVLSQDVYSAWMIDLMFELLIGGSVVDGSDIPTGLADSWEISADGIEYTIHLNENVVWHDGTPFTSADVIATFDGALAENSQS